MLPCFWFGHAIPITEKSLLATVNSDTFKCSRCGKKAKWADQAKRIQKLRAELIAALKQQLN